MDNVPVTLLDAELPMTKCSKLYYIQEQIVMYMNCLYKLSMHQCPGVGGGGGWGGALKQVWILELGLKKGIGK